MRTVATKGGASKLSVACGQWQKNVNGIIIRREAVVALSTVQGVEAVVRTCSKHGGECSNKEVV
jgi:hypothetical protein